MRQRPTPDSGWPTLHAIYDAFTPIVAADRVVVFGSWVRERLHGGPPPQDLDLLAVGWGLRPSGLRGALPAVAAAACLPVHVLTCSPDAWTDAGGWIAAARQGPHLVLSTRRPSGAGTRRRV